MQIPFQSTTGERKKVKVIVRLNIHGIVSVDSEVVSSKDKAFPFYHKGTQSNHVTCFLLGLTGILKCWAIRVNFKIKYVDC